MKRTLFLLALLACSGDLAPEPKQKVVEPPAISFESVALRYESAGTVVETIVRNDGGSGYYWLRFWATGQPPWIARDTEPRWAQTGRSYETHWLVVRWEHVELDSVELWERALPGTVWEIADRYEFGG